MQNEFKVGVEVISGEECWSRIICAKRRSERIVGNVGQKSKPKEVI